MVEVRLDIQENASANPETRTTQVVALTDIAGLSMTDLPKPEKGIGLACDRYSIRSENPNPEQVSA